MVTMKTTQLAGVPLNLSRHPAGFLPALRLIAEAGVVATHVMRQSFDRALEQLSYLVLWNPVGRQPDRVADAFGFEKLVDLWVGKGRVAAEITPLHRAPVTAITGSSPRAGHLPRGRFSGRKAHRSRSPSWLNTKSG